MKFLCVPCDKPMQLLQATPPDRGSVSLVYSCDACGYEFAMLTNPHETQVVTSLGVTLGKDGVAESKCPFTGVLAEMETAEDGIRWTAGAQERMSSVPEFVRPMARSGIEKYAKDQGYAEIDEKVLAEARSHFGM
ncbi:MAG: PCP reductase family protein [Acidobacteria bacterium]|nr:PCP reductase family protein [Acidobacteriota bacterium]